MIRPWVRPGFWAIVGSHVLADFYIGAVTATLPYFVTRAHYSYADIAGLALAQTVVASISQPGFGLLADRYRLRWAVPACIAVAGLSTSLSTARPGHYALVWLMVALAGMASAGYHPPATMIVRDLAPGSNVVMSVFAASGNLGIALGPLAVVLVVGPLGLAATRWLIVPGAIGLVAYLLVGSRDDVLRQRIRPLPAPIPAPGSVVSATSEPKPYAVEPVDRWAWFGLLMGSMTVWQICFVCANTFIGIFMIREFGSSEAVASVPLALIPAAGAVGTLLGGWTADRVGRPATIRVGYTAALAGAASIAAAPTGWVAVAGTCLLGAGIFLPFAPHITLSHSYLPRRIGTASGISIGVTSALAGLVSAGLGHLADASGLRLVFVVLAGTLVVGVAIGFTLRDPEHPGRRRLVSEPDLAIAETGP